MNNIELHSTLQNQAVMGDTPRQVTREDYGKAYQMGYRRTIGFLVSRGLPVDSAAEVAQEAWVKGWEKLAQLRDPAMLSQWINTIALNIHRSHLHKPSFETLPEISAPPTQDFASIMVGQILSLCTSSERFLLKKHHIDGLQIAEIAREQGCTELAARIRLLRARRAAKARMDRIPTPIPEAPCIPCPVSERAVYV